MIDEYRFGQLIIDGKIYNNDVEVRWNDEVLLWLRAESHKIRPKDVKRAVEADPEIIVIGTGEEAKAEVDEEAKREIRSKGIRLIIDATDDAAKTFNIIKEESLEEEGVQAKVIGLFHLTC